MNKKEMILGLKERHPEWGSIKIHRYLETWNVDTSEGYVESVLYGESNPQKPQKMIPMRVPAEYMDVLKEHAKAQGKTLRQFVLDALDKAMEA